jgi:hypothetical protein
LNGEPTEEALPDARHVLRLPPSISALMDNKKLGGAGMIEGICPKCGQHYYGWALCQPINQSCKECGVKLFINPGGQVTPREQGPAAAGNDPLDTRDTPA